MYPRGPGAQRARAKSTLSLVALVASLVTLAFGVDAACAFGAAGVELPHGLSEQARGFWTPARMREARPLPLLRPGPSGLVTAAAGSASASASGAGGEVPRRVGPLASGGASASSTFDLVPDPAAVGSRESGAIFFELEGELARCSGTSVSAGNLSVVFTAGHCVNSGGPGGRWYRGRWVFVPGYRYGQRPFGVFPAKWLDTTRQWRSSGTENADIAAAVVARNERGERLGEAVGGTGIAFGLSPHQSFEVHGYPAAPPFDGETQRLCRQTPFLGHDPSSFFWPGPLNLAVDCNVTGGASGGGWTIAGNLLNSVTNYGYSDDPDTDFGPYFGREAARLYARAERVR